MKRIFFYLLIVSSSLVFSQKINFNIKNDDAAIKKVFFSDISGKILKTILENENNFAIDYMELEEGYYLMKKDKHEVLLYLKPSDNLTISFDNEELYNTITFSGEGAKINNYLLNRNLDKIDKRGNLLPFFKKEFYEVNEDEYLDKLDGYYKEQYGYLFNRRFDKKFLDEETKELQYSYSLDLLKYQDAKKYYKLQDSLAPSDNFLEPLNHIHFQNTELFKKYNSYKDLTVLKHRNDVLAINEHPIRDEIISSLKHKPLREKVLRSLVPTMTRDRVTHTKSVFNLIKKYTHDSKLMLDAKEKYALIQYKDALKNLSKLKFKDIHDVERNLSDFKGNYIFINFWTVNCDLCTRSFPEIEELKEEFSDQEISFISIAVDKKDSFLRWKGTMDEIEAKAPQFFYDGIKANIIKDFKIKSIPAFVMLSKSGKPMDIQIRDLKDKKTRRMIYDLLKD